MAVAVMKVKVGYYSRMVRASHYVRVIANHFVINLVTHKHLETNKHLYFHYFSYHQAWMNVGFVRAVNL